MPTPSGEVARSLAELRVAVADHAEMAAAVGRMIERPAARGARYSEEEIDETVAFLEWLREHHFVFLGYPRLRDRRRPDGPALGSSPAPGLGILRDEARSTYAAGLPLVAIAAGAARAHRGRRPAADLEDEPPVDACTAARAWTTIDVKRIDADGAVSASSA